MKILLLLPLLLGFSVPAIAHNEFNGGDAMHSEEKESADLTGGENLCLGAKGELVPC